MMSIFQKRETKDVLKVRDLPLPDQILIALHFIGFYVFLGFYQDFRKAFVETSELAMLLMKNLEHAKKKKSLNVDSA